MPLRNSDKFVPVEELGIVYPGQAPRKEVGGSAQLKTPAALLGLVAVSVAAAAIANPFGGGSTESVSTESVAERDTPAPLVSTAKLAELEQQGAVDVITAQPNDGPGDIVAKGSPGIYDEDLGTAKVLEARVEADALAKSGNENKFPRVGDTFVLPDVPGYPEQSEVQGEFAAAGLQVDEAGIAEQTAKQQAQQP